MDTISSFPEIYQATHKCFGVAVCVGPGDLERSRFEDFANSLFYYEPRVSFFAVVDDSVSCRPLLSRINLPEHCKATLISNPREGRGSGWGAGLTAAIVSAFRWIHDNGTASFVLKADTDTLIVAPFSEQIQRQFCLRPDIGMLGSYLRYPDRSRNLYVEREIAPAMEKLLRQMTIWRRTYDKWPRLQIGCFGKYGRIRTILRHALLNGYVLGEYCCGGGYAVSGSTLAGIGQTGLLDEPLLWINTPCSDDVVLSLYVKRVCKGIMDFNGMGEPFCVKNPGLPFPPDEILKRGYSIVHSVKSYKQYSESDTRSFFSLRRNNHGNAILHSQRGV